MANIQGKVGQGVVPVTLRLPVDLRDEVKAQADEMGRSMNTHILMTLKQSLSAEKPATA
ncbi:Arc family DNA-binding protein [Sulfitobacter sp. R18_1]|uniref:Arc family DNA-binding protein n=1 Tax=Sulfitobacter sp. OXR-159 TaxID=3100174 RepID=UPI001AD9B65B|nr:Arc family DNA-binding protein [Sulfitobacter sp. R18_1]